MKIVRKSDLILMKTFELTHLIYIIVEFLRIVLKLVCAPIEVVLWLRWLLSVLYLLYPVACLLCVLLVVQVTV